jgi:type IV pilus assembly protein PilM
MLNFLTLKHKTFGFDISDLSLKIIKLKKERDFLGLASFAEASIKPGVIERGKIKDEKVLVKAIKEILNKVKGEKLNTKYVIASLPEEEAFLQVIQMPEMGEEELKKAVQFEAENYIPLPIEKVYLDSQVVPPVHNHLDHVDVLIAALPKKIVDSYLSVFQQAGLKPLAFEIESQAVSRALIKNGLSPEPLLLVDLGACRTSLIIFSGYSLRFTSSLPISGQKFTELISKKLKINTEKAEKVKIEKGIEAPGLTASLDELAEQIKKYLEYHRTHSAHEHLLPDGEKIEKIILCGGGANLKGLPDFLSQKLQVQVSLGNPWQNILPEPLQEVPELSYEESLKYTTALGLALRGTEN